MKDFPKQIFYLPVIAITTFFLALSLYTKFIGSIPFSVTSTTTTKTDLFTVQGQGKVSAIPDTAEVTLGITISRPNVTSAQNEVNRIINKITQDLKQLGIEEKDIKTINYTVNPDYDYSGGKPKISGYTVTVNLEVKTKKLEKINGVIDTATSNGANLIGGLNFTFSEEKQKELRSGARKQAVEEAKVKAQELASAAGIKLGRIINVQEETTFPWERPVPLMVERAVTAPSEETQIQPGESKIQVTVTLSYEIR